MNPFFSIIIPSYNRPELSVKAVKSILCQKFSDFEILFVDDGSTDNTKEKVLELNDSRVIYIYQTNQERGAARNNGIRNSKGQYICFLDSDDSFLENHLQEIYDFLKNKRFPVAMVFTNNKLLDSGVFKEKHIPALSDQNIFVYLLQYTPNPARVAVHRNVFNDLSFDETIPGIEDIDLWLHIATKYKIYHHPVITNIYNLHDESYSTDFKERVIKELEMLKYIFKKPTIKKHLPAFGKRRLLSRNLFFSSQYYFAQNLKLKMYKSIILTVMNYPHFSNTRRNYMLLVMFLLKLPLIGFVINKVNRSFKN